jgi:hypothetical protein
MKRISGDDAVQTHLGVNVVRPHVGVHVVGTDYEVSGTHCKANLQGNSRAEKRWSRIIGP